jgi:signal recognition particle subunit SRP54
MFDRLTERLGHTLAQLTGKGRLTEDNISDALRQVRMALIEADVALPVIKSLIEAVKPRALGVEVQKSLTPAQVFIKILHDELVTLMGPASDRLDLRHEPPVTVLLAGLQGAGKTTTAAKLAKRLQETEKKRVLLASVDVYRPAAILQLERLAAQIGAGFLHTDSREPLTICAEAKRAAKNGNYDVLLLDTAGRLHVDAEMMSEIQRVDAAVQPHQRLFVVDAMAGQDALNSAKAFHAALDLTGIVLSKADGDARGGAALSVRYLTGRPIVFVGTGEKLDALEAFYPERLASRILGMGDVVSLVEQVHKDIDHEKAAQLAAKLNQGKGFDLNDLKQQMLQIQNMGGLTGLLDKMPAALAKAANQAGPAGMDERSITRQIAIIDSMTKKERRRPDILDGSRKRRVANGAGVQVQDVNKLLKQFMQMQSMMKQFSKGGLKNMMRMMGSKMGGGFRPFG